MGEQGRLVVAALNREAAAAGLFPGQALADARAILPSLLVMEHDPRADAATLDRLADWCSRYSPWVALDGADGLFLEITGCAHLFGGEEAMLADVQARVEKLGFAARAALADTPGAAWAAARFGIARDRAAWVVPLGGARAALASLPVAALRIGSAESFDLGRLGLRRIGDLYDLPRPPLAARFGERLLLRLDQALGSIEEPLTPRRPVSLHRARMGFAEPILAPEDIARAIAHLLHELCERLQREQAGARKLELALYRVDGAVSRIPVGTARPNRDPERLMALFAQHLDKIDPGFGIEIVVLAAPVVEECAPEQRALAPDGQASRQDLEEDLAALIERLSNRLDARAVIRLLPRESHIPERAQRRSPALGRLSSRSPSSGSHGGSHGGAPAFRGARPLRLFAIPQPIEAVAPIPDDPPLLFRWRRAAHRVRLAEGPERIACEWWREEAPFRDYYRVEDWEGRRFWLYREGLYRPEIPARWFLHGMFP